MSARDRLEERLQRAQAQATLRVFGMLGFALAGPVALEQAALDLEASGAPNTAAFVRCGNRFDWGL